MCSWTRTYTDLKISGKLDPELRNEDFCGSTSSARSASGIRPHTQIQLTGSTTGSCNFAIYTEVNRALARRTALDRAGELFVLAERDAKLRQLAILLRQICTYGSVYSSLQLYAQFLTRTDIYRNGFHYALHFPLGIPTLYSSFVAWHRLRAQINSVEKGSLIYTRIILCASPVTPT